MPENDVFKRYLDAGLAFTQITRAKAEELVKEWVKAGELQRDQAQTRVDDLVDRSRKNSEQFFETIRSEIAKQLAALGVATKKDLADLERRLDSRVKASSAGASAPAAGAARKAPATKSATTKSATTKSATTKSAGTPGTKKSAAKKAPAKKATGGQPG